jgi:hypothetical protein
LLVEGIPECNVSTVLDGKAVTFNSVIVASIEYRLPPEHKVDNACKMLPYFTSCDVMRMND